MSFSKSFFWGLVLGLVFLAASSFAETWTIQGKITAPNGGTLEVNGQISNDFSQCVTHYDYEECRENETYTYVFDNFVTYLGRSPIVINGSYTYTSSFDPVQDKERESLDGAGSLVIGDQNYDFSVQMLYEDDHYSGTITLNGQTFPIDDNLGDIISDLFYNTF